MRVPTIVDKPEMMVMGIECRTSNDPHHAQHDIPKLWQKFYGEDVFRNIPHKASSEVVVLYCDYEGDFTKPYSCVIGCFVTSFSGIPKGMVAKRVPGATFAHFQAKGDFPQSLMETWQQIWKSKLKRTYVGDYEIYGKNFSSDPIKEVDIWVGIAP